MRRLQRPEATVRPTNDERRWSLLTAHAQVLLCIARDPDTRVREIAVAVGISERGAHQIIADLVDAGYVRRARVGRRNRYAIESKTTVKDGPVRHRRIGSIVALLDPEPGKAERPAKSRRAPRGRVAVNESVIAKPSRRRAA